MSSNAGPKIAAIGTSVVDRETEMSAFDQLDPRIKEVIRTAPVAFCARDILELQNRFGPEETLRRGLEFIRRTFPDWTPI